MASEDHRLRLPDKLWHQIEIVSAVLRKRPNDLAREVLEQYTREAVFSAKYPAAKKREEPEPESEPIDPDQPTLFQPAGPSA